MIQFPMLSSFSRSRVCCNWWRPILHACICLLESWVWSTSDSAMPSPTNSLGTVSWGSLPLSCFCTLHSSSQKHGMPVLCLALSMAWLHHWLVSEWLIGKASQCFSSGKKTNQKKITKTSAITVHVPLSWQCQSNKGTLVKIGFIVAGSLY